MSVSVEVSVFKRFSGRTLRNAFGKKRRVFKMEPKKPFSAVFEKTGLDKNPKIRRKVARIARKVMKKKGRGSSSSGSVEESGDEGVP